VIVTVGPMLLGLCAAAVMLLVDKLRA